MQIGIFAKTFDEPTLEGVLDEVVGHRLEIVQFNLKCAGVDSLPEVISDELCHRVRSIFKRYRLRMEAISGTYNIIDPDVRQRDEMTRRACGLIERAHDLGTQVVTLCTGTCHPNNMWHPHPGNDDRSAWQAMTATLEKLLAVAEAHNVTLGIEPERANVINSAVKARRILDQMQSKRLAIVLDGANLFDPENVEHMQQVLTEAIDLLGSDIAIAHAKDIPDDPAANHRAAGTGRLDWLTYLQLMHSIGFDGPLILHGLLPSQVSASIMFLQQLCTQISCNSSKAAINDA